MSSKNPTGPTTLYSPVKSDVSLPHQEEEILAFWDREKIFEKSLAQPGGVDGKAGAPKTYSFYDGPPFATGLPHYGHILAGVLKDVVPRYWTMQGYTVPRRFGWDCHGLPVEYEINKVHKIDSRKDVLRMGIDNYNAACRGIVERYTEEWKKTVRRVGRWVDMDKPYFTMDVSFMQSVWWVFQELYKKGLVYEGYKVVPYSVGISTPLSNFEANQNYKMVQDPALTVSFPLLKEPGVSFLAWTTTPWTLPSNLALAVHRDTDYVRVREKSTGHVYIFGAALLGSVFKKPGKVSQAAGAAVAIPVSNDDAEVLATVKGSELLGIEYEPLFAYFKDLRAKGAFKVIHSDHVTTDSGTGIVHMAPAFGEDDYYACAREGIPIVNPVDDDGMFTAEVPEYQGRRVKEADKDIALELKKRGRLFKQETIDHSYPFCYRSDTPLIYRAVSSWFIAVEKIKAQLLASNSTTEWVPESLRDGRFGNWLENARDWAVSRNRFWGTPLPLWKNEEGEVLCIGSKAELEKLTHTAIGDLHIDVIGKLTIPSPTGKSPLKHVGSVLDCWFESGSMPYAQWGYPHAGPESEAKFKAAFPAEFIAEGLDQTRGWFYTLMVIGTALFGKSPFKHVVVNGMVLAEDGRKMSKSLRNYPDPMEVLGKHGADALRLCLIDSPVVRAQELKFSEKAVHDIVRKILLRWWNSYSFFVSYGNIDRFVPRGDAAQSPNLLDQWVMSRLHSLIANTQSEMAAYRLYNVVPHLLQFIEDLTNTYIRFNRSHFWQDGMPQENEAKRYAYETLHEVLVTLSRLMAPFAPFLAEVTYRNLTSVLPEAQRKLSVHLESFPSADARRVRPELEDAVRAMDALVTLGRNQREKIGVKAKIPLRTMRIIHRDPRLLENLKRFEPYFKDELNVQAVAYESDEDQFVQITAKANFPVLGKRLGAKMKIVGSAIAKLPLTTLLELERGEPVSVEGEAITLSDIDLRREPKGGNANLATHQLVSIELDPTVTPEQEREGLAREIIRKIQAARKAADFNLDDRIELELAFGGPGGDALRAAAETHQAMISGETLALKLTFVAAPQGQHVETADIDGAEVTIGLKPIRA
jgi:isoleucyl-tRNA synthetase